MSSYVHSPQDVSAADEGGHSGGGLFGKLKDKTKKATSKIKTKVANRHSDDPHVEPTNDDEEGQEYEDSPQTAFPGSHATPFESTPREPQPRTFDSFEASAAPASSQFIYQSPVSSYKPEETAAGHLPSDTGNYDDKIPGGFMKPKDFDTEGSEGGGYGYSGARAPTSSPYGSGVGSNRAEQSSHVQKPLVSDKGEGAFAGALSYGGKSEDDSSRDPMYKSGQDYGNRGYEAAQDTKNTAAEKASEGYERTVDTLTSGSDCPDAPGSATDSAYQAKDHVKERASDLNNATNDSDTYTQKAASTAYAVKDKAADTLGMNQPSEGPSVVDQAKGYIGMAVDTTKDQAYRAKDAAAGYAGATNDTIKDYAGATNDTTKDYAGATNDTTKDYADSSADITKDTASSAADTARGYTYGAKDAVQNKAAELNNATDDSETYTQKAANAAYGVKDKITESTGMNQPSTGPSLLDKAKGYVGGARDTTMDNTRSAIDTTKNYAEESKDATKDHASSAADTTHDHVDQSSTGTSMLDQAKGYLGMAADKTQQIDQRATDTTKDYAGSATDNTKNYSASASDTSKDYVRSAADTTKYYGGSAYDTSAQYAQVAKEKAAENAAFAKDRAADAAQSANDVTKDYARTAYDTSAGYAQVGKEKAAENATIVRDKAAETATATKDKTVEVTTPGAAEKGLSEKITEALSNLPFQAKDKAAVTAQSAAQTTTVAAQDAAQKATAAAHEEAHKDSVFGRLTGLLGYGKQPVQHDAPLTSDSLPSTVAKDERSAYDVAAVHDAPSSGPTQ